MLYVAIQDSECIFTTIEAELYTQLYVSIRTEDDYIMAWEIRNDVDEEFNSAMKFSYDEQGQADEGVDDRNFLNRRPSIEAIVTEDTCSEGEEECDEDGLSYAKRIVAVAHY